MIVMAVCPIATYWALPQPVVADAAAAPVTHFDSEPSEMTALVPAGREAGRSRPVLAEPRPAAWDEAARAWLLAALPWASAGWAGGVVVLAARLLAGIVGVLRLRRGAVPLSRPLLERVDHLAERLGPAASAGHSCRSTSRILAPSASGGRWCSCRRRC